MRLDWSSIADGVSDNPSCRLDRMAGHRGASRRLAQLPLRPISSGIDRAEPPNICATDCSTGPRRRTRFEVSGVAYPRTGRAN
jgi:hypothetical protein